VKEELSALQDVSPKVYGFMADVFSQYYRRKEDQENFYNSAMMFLAYTSTDDLTAEEKRSWATKMGMAVLLGKNIFNISELVSIFKNLTLDIVRQRNSSKLGWIRL
jgi:26S proteasome regulatory subunit N9